MGVQTERLPDTDVVRYSMCLQVSNSHLLHPQVVYVMPSTSGRAASHPRRVDKLKFFYELKELRDRLKLQHGKTPTKDAAYSQLGTASDQPSDLDLMPKSQPSSISVPSGLKDQSLPTEPSPSVSNSTSNGQTVSTTAGEVPTVTATTSIALPVASTAVTGDNDAVAHLLSLVKISVIYSTTGCPGVVATPPTYSPASTTMPVSGKPTGGSINSLPVSQGP